MQQPPKNKLQTINILRQVHLHFSLFLLPWMLIYAASTVVMNHREYFHHQFGKPVDAASVVENDIVYSGRFARETPPGEVADVLLAHLGLSGSSSVRGKLSDEKITIERHSLLAPRKVTYWPGSGRLVQERREVNLAGFMEGFHRRRGYGKGYAADNAWAVVVDLVIVAMIFWAISGVWIWWSLPPARKPGLLAVCSGTALFILFLCTI